MKKESNKIIVYTDQIRCIDNIWLRIEIFRYKDREGSGNDTYFYSVRGCRAIEVISSGFISRSYYGDIETDKLRDQVFQILKKEIDMYKSIFAALEKGINSKIGIPDNLPVIE